MADTDVVNYFLAKSVVRVRSQRTTIKDPYSRDAPPEFVATAELLTVADREAERRLELPRGGTRSSKMTWRDDRRLSAFVASHEGGGPRQLKVVTTLATVALGVAVAALTPAGVGPLIGAGLAAGAAKALGEKAALKFGFGPDDDDPVEAQLITILNDYDTDGHPVEADLLRRYRAAMRSLRERHAEAASTSNFETIEQLSKTLNLIRDEMAPLEAKLASWIVDQIESVEENLKVVDFDLEDLPTFAEAKKFWQPDGSDRSIVRGVNKDQPAWVEGFKRLGIGVSVDYDGAPEKPHQDEDHDRDQGIRVEYRPAVPATIRVWSILWTGASLYPPATSESTGMEVPRWKATVTDVQRIRVVRPTAPVRLLTMEESAWRDGNIDIEFSDLGEPSSISRQSTAQAAVAIAEASGAVGTGVKSGIDLTTGLVTAGLERELKIAKTRKDISDLDPPKSDPNKALEEAVKVAELEARLQMAKLLKLQQSAPTAWVVTG